jgi:hypothetical protein
MSRTSDDWPHTEEPRSLVFAASPVRVVSVGPIRISGGSRPVKS